jgi:uncharacterized protein YkwD
MTCHLQGKRTHCASVRICALVLTRSSIFLVLTVSPAAAGTRTVTTDSTLMRQLASELNLSRRDAGKPGLRYSPALAAAAAARARALAAQGWADKPLAGTALRRKVRQFYGAGSTWQAGETVLWADGTICGSAVLYYWLDKLRDKTTVMSSRWTEAGIAAVRANGDTFVVVEYGTRT